jgi:hypothetical protein
LGSEVLGAASDFDDEEESELELELESDLESLADSLLETPSLDSFISRERLRVP